MGSTTVTKQMDTIIVGQNTCTFPALSLPSGSSFTRFKVTKTTTVILGVASFPPGTTLAFDTWYTNASYMNWSANGDTPKLSITNTNGYVTSSSFTITVEYSASYTAVTAGNFIKATDYTQTGASVSAGDVIKISNKFTAGTDAKASTFNSSVLGL